MFLTYFIIRGRVVEGKGNILLNIGAYGISASKYDFESYKKEKCYNMFLIVLLIL